MATLREIRKKLHSVENVKKITQAMELVAGARLRRAQVRTENARPYMLELKLILDNLIGSSDDLSHPLITKRPVKRLGIVVIGADKGLCGSYNNNIFGATNRFLETHSDKEVELFLVGHKPISYFNNKKWPISKKLLELAETEIFPAIQQLAHELIDSFLKGSLDEVWLVYTHFQNIMTHKVVVEKLLNIDIPPPAKDSYSTNYIFEPNEQEIFGAILPRYCSSKLQLAMNEASTSELAARILAMRAATKNADEMANNLTLERNKLRQTGITRELIEITAGAEASKSLF